MALAVNRPDVRRLMEWIEPPDWIPWSYYMCFCLYTITFRSVKHNGRTHTFELLQYIFLSSNTILIGIYQTLLLQLRFDMYSILTEKNLYLNVVWFVDLCDWLNQQPLIALITWISIIKIVLTSLLTTDNWDVELDFTFCSSTYTYK